MEPKINQSSETVTERVEFLCDKSLFKGKVYRPFDLESCKGIVIFTHGLGYCDRQYKIKGEDFAQKNYLMLTYNLRGHAGTPGKWTLQNSAEDLIEGINFLVHRYQFPNNERICVIGHSTGALITLLASLKDKRIKFGSIVTTVTCLTDSYLHWFRSGFNQEVKDFFKSKGRLPPIINRFMDDSNMLNLYREGRISRDELEIEHRYGMLRSDSWNEFFYEIANSINIIELADKLTIPLLLFRGEYDEVMDVQKTNELYENLDRRLPSKLYITGSRNHFHNDKWDLIQAETLKFFDEFCAYHLPRANILEKDILVIDDEVLVTQTLKALLKKNGFSNVTTVNRAEGAFQEIEKLRAQKNKEFDMIIADIRLPGLDGIAAVKRIRELIAQSNGRQSQVIFITGYEGDRTQQQAKEVGYVDYLYKPFDMEDFFNQCTEASEMIKRILARLEDLFYRGLLKSLLKTSKLGHGLVVTGAESGANFEHMYNNKPQGTFIIGRYIDKALLNLQAVQATRGRKEDIKRVLWNEVHNNKLLGRKTRVLDLASGGARYLRELAEEHRNGDIESICIDKDRACVKLGRDLSKNEKLKNIRFFRGNIFQVNHLKKFSSKITWQPNVVVASGLFIYFNNEAVEKIIKEIHGLLAQEGIIVFSSYEYLNTKKLMRKTMATSAGKEWTLYYRKPDYWRLLLSDSGFRQIFILRDQWSMNNICTARK